MKEELRCKELTIDNLNEIVRLGKKLNPNLSLEEIKESFLEMFTFPTYYCFGLIDTEDKIIGISSGWITHKLYSKKQLEIDNVIIDPNIQSKGYGKIFLEKIDDWAKNYGCKTLELNTYVTNNRSHKFYFNNGYSIIGYHFQKQL
ncbi:GNAT family N-acetyltransferase [Tenacibaculum sp. 190524A02b]|uniref:GNAT family N-acetyltransferase n=1 Tax=Tenacibaculum vairaonense TaxID=3137860 RepID=UPI0031FA6DE3